MILPEDLAQLVSIELSKKSVHYAKVMMKVGELLEGEFFTEAIKKGA